MSDDFDWEEIAHLSNQFHPYHRAARAFGKGEEGMDLIFRGHVEATTPWQKAGRQKKTGMYLPGETDSIAQELRRTPPMLRDTDPRPLLASQPSIVAHHVRYYLGDEYDVTGETSADQGNLGNRFPVILNRPSRNQKIIIAGHHRAAAALVQGRPLRALHVEGS